MTSVDFISSNKVFGPPPDLDKNQCGAIHAHVGQVVGGSCDGLPMIITAWRPTPEELERINMGAPIFVTFVSSGLPPHMLTTSVEEATRPA